MPDSNQSLVLKNPGIAAFLAWLVPGLGHIYQGRTLKGVLFCITVCGLFFFGSWLGSWRVVYLRWDNEEWRISFWGQVGMGLVALPAAVDAMDLRPTFANAVPLLADYQARPLTWRELESLCEQHRIPRGGSGAESAQRLRESGAAYVVSIDEVDELHRKFGVAMHIALMYTLIAGLLNVLIVYDAFAGPAHYQEDLAEDQAKAAGESGAAA